MRNGHRILGSALFILGKINIYIGLYSYGLNTLLITAVVWSFTLLFIISGFEVLNFVIEKGIKYRTNHVIASEALNKLPIKDNHQTLLDLINVGYSRGEILSKLPLMNWVMLNNQVYDLTGMQHPGGNYIMESVKGREIGRFFFGAYSLELTTL